MPIEQESDERAGSQIPLAATLIANGRGFNPQEYGLLQLFEQDWTCRRVQQDVLGATRSG